MNTLGSLGGIITKGVFSVSGSFQPFGGAVDIIVVEQPDGSFRSSPWYVRFGKFQGVLKIREKIVKIVVNGEEADFHMHLSSKGQAFFVKEDGEDVDNSIKGDQWHDECASSSGNTPVKSKSNNFVGSATAPSSPYAGTHMPRSNSDQSETLGIHRLNSLECAEIAAHLLDFNWITGSPKMGENREKTVPRFDIGDSVYDKKCDVSSKMEEKCICPSESQKSIKPTVSRSTRVTRTEAQVHSANSSNLVAGPDTFNQETAGINEDSGERVNDKESNTTQDTAIGRPRPMIPKSFLHESFTSQNLEEPRPVLKQLNSEGNKDAWDSSHRLSQSLDMNSNSSRPPAFFSRSLGGREGSLMQRQPEKEGSDNAISKKSAPAVARTEHEPQLKRTTTDRTTRVFCPTSEQLASLKLDKGGNAIVFTFWTKMLGKQQVDARIYLWKWSDRIIISDVDGTITKSDVLGQCMPLVGMDWSQEGVARLYSAIKENGYQMMFLSARSISQAYITRQFLLNLKQDGMALPDGPVVISPDGLFPSLYREVIRRVPHEFKIACLEDIKALFPPDCNPFYAGFGNRDTDEISYLKVGIPQGKIFTINPKGEIVVNQHIQTISYTSIHAIVNGMFPSMALTEQEDFNSWNFWKLPPPLIDV